jgi:tetratricopeptide (TPR) repeat protein
MNREIEQTNNPKFWLEKGDSYLKESNYEKALRFFERAISIDSNYQEAWNKKAIALQYLGRIGEAIEANNMAIIINNNNFLKTINKINTEGSVGNKSKLDNQVIDKNYSERLNQEKINRIHKLLEIGTEKYQKDQWRKALTYFEKAIEINPNNSYAWNRKANILKKLGKLEEALICFNQTLKLKKNSANAWNDKGNLLCALERFVEALDCYEKALNLSEDKLWMAWVNKGIVLLYLKGYEEAICNWNEGLNKLDFQQQDYQKAYGYLSWQIAKAFYLQGKQKLCQFDRANNPYFAKSLKNYNQALEKFNACFLPIKKLEVLKDIWQLYHIIADQKNQQKVYFQGNKLLIDLIKKTSTQQSKLILTKEFACFSNRKKNP